MVSGHVRVTVEWALWGSDRTGTRVLACSEGSIGSNGFDTLLVRYSPGELDNLSQVAIAWSRDGGPDQVLMAFHDRRAPARHGDGRIVNIRLFCVPFGELAAGPVGYLALYDELSRLEPASGSKAPVVIELPVTKFADLAENCDPLAIRVAAILLTNKRVCVLGAESIGLRERVKFIDTVAALLPYGLRSRLSASTLVSSNFDLHKMRLYFAAEQRQSEDQDRKIVHWGQEHDEPVGTATADYYLWMLNNGSLTADQLAQCTRPMAFRKDDIDEMVESLAVHSAGNDDAARPAAGPGDQADVEKLLRFCAESVAGGQARLPVAVSMLRRHQDKPRKRAERLWLADLIAQLGLLRDDPGGVDHDLDADSLAEFRDAVLRLAFKVPLNYQSYCLIEAASGRSPGQPASVPLAKVMLEIGLEPPLQVLAAKAAGEAEFKEALRDAALTAESIVMMAANPLVQASHAQAMCEIVTSYPEAQRGRAHRESLRAALGQHGYLAPTAERLFPDDAQAQLGLLDGIVRAAHGSRLDRSAIYGVLGNKSVMPTVPLLAAVVRLANPAEAQGAGALFAAHHVATVKFGEKENEELWRVLAGNVGQQPA